MSAGGARRGRRDNGLDAREYAAAGDVDPRVGEHLLDVLGAAGIAAYLQPSADLNPVTRTTTVPARPTDRLYVDRSHLGTARDYVARLAEDEASDTAPSDPDVDAEWARIVAGYNTTTETRPWPAAEDLTGDDSTDRHSTTEPAPDSTDRHSTTEPGPDSTDRGRPDPPGSGAYRLPSAADISGISVGRRGDEPSLLDGLDTFGADLPDDPEEGYTPPPPPPLPQVSKYAVVAVLAITVGFVLFLYPNLLPIGGRLATLIGFLGILGGFVTLVWRMRPGDDDDDDPDDGAVV